MSSQIHLNLIFFFFHLEKYTNRVYKPWAGQVFHCRWGLWRGIVTFSCPLIWCGRLRRSVRSASVGCLLWWYLPVCESNRPVVQRKDFGQNCSITQVIWDSSRNSQQARKICMSTCPRRLNKSCRQKKSLFGKYEDAMDKIEDDQILNLGSLRTTRFLADLFSYYNLPYCLDFIIWFLKFLHFE